MPKQLMIGLAIVVILVVVGVLVMMSKNSNPTPATSVETTTETPTQTTPDNTATSAPEASSDSTMTQGPVKQFIVSGSNFKFEPAILTVNKGDTVKITFKNSGGEHDFVIDEFKVRTNTIQSGELETVQFTADKAGIFDYYCSVGTHRAMGMQGKLTVK